MSNLDERIAIIKEVEQIRDSKVICYLTGDRPGFETRIGKDVFSHLYSHLNNFGNVKNIDLFLYTRGGDTIAAFGIVNQIREFCEKFSVLIPYKAHSAGTLISLGADEIIMTKLGQLGPIDPSITTPYNPTTAPNPLNPQQQFLPVSVEEVIGFLHLAKKEADLTAPGLLDNVFKSLTDKVHPLALGSVYRAKEQIGMLAEKLLSTHPSGTQEEKKKIISTLTKELYSHDYIISRKEAKRLKLNVVDVDSKINDKIWNLYKAYEKELEQEVPFNSEAFLGTLGEATGEFYRAFIESAETTHTFVTKKEFKRFQVTVPNMPVPQAGIQERIMFEGWRKER